MTRERIGAGGSVYRIGSRDRVVPTEAVDGLLQELSRFLLLLLLLWVCGQRVCVVQAKRHIHSRRRCDRGNRAAACSAFGRRERMGHWSLVAR